MTFLFCCHSRFWFSQINKKRFSMTSEMKSDLYEKAVFELNNLQSNAEVLAKLQNHPHFLHSLNIPESLKLLEHLKISIDDIDKLNCIHVTGTKGKGSTCAFVESILQRCGFKTGFYSSPHLVNVRERIRVNGRPLSKDAFAEYFFSVFDAIQEHKDKESKMPGYFKFLTLMAFKVFCKEKVDVGIIEVGIGGENDCTNIIQNPIVCGLTTLDFDHTRLLGTTLSEIAWQKAGIMKSGSIMVSVAQPKEALDVIQNRSIEKKSLFFVVPDVRAYSWPHNVLPSFGISGEHQHINVSVALQLVRFWLLRTGKNLDLLPFLSPETELMQSSAFQVPPFFVEALKSCIWPGRSQVLRKSDKLIFFLDSAHTPLSIKYCSEWFSKQTVLIATENSNVMRLLIFHCIGDRDPKVMLMALKDCNFDFVLFCPTKLENTTNQSNDNTKISYQDSTGLNKCSQSAEIWNEIVNKNCATFPCIKSTLKHVYNIAGNNPNNEIHTLVTGSVHLVGGVLHFEKPDIFSNVS